MKKYLLSGVLILLFAMPLAAAEKESVKEDKKQTQCYKILSGKEDKMCRLFQENLNRFCKKQPFVCEPPIHPDYAKYFSVPKWEAVDYKTHLDVIEQYIKIRAIIPINCSGQCVAETREKKWQEYKPELLKRLESGKIKFVRALVKIKFDDKPRIAYKLVDTICSPADDKNLEIARKSGLMIFDEDTGKPNEYYSITPKLWGHNDIIVYQGEAYFLTLDELYISPTLESQTWIKCHYKYIDRNEGGKK